MKKMLAALSAVAMIAVGCSDDDDGDDATPVDACETAVDEGGNADALVDENTNLDAGIEVCSSYDALAAATEKFPNALGGQDLATVVAERCAAGISGAACGEIPS
ncbi:MAG: hypothetical protein AAFY28_08605 [Actinomycetota bacterium]